MSSRNLLNLVLLVVIAALVAVVVYEPGKKVPPVIKLTTLTKSAITKIEITRPGNPKVVLAKTDSKWRMLEPYAMPANDFKVEAITDLAEAKSTAQYPIKPGENLKQYGLDKPGITVVFNGKDKLEFGKTEPLKYQRYIRHDNTLHLIFDRFYYNLSAAAAEYVDHALLQGRPTITKLVLPKLTLTAQGDKWQAEPAIKQLSNDQVNELLDNWTGAHATDMLDYKPAKVSEQTQVFIKGQDKPLVFDILRENKAISLGRADLGIKYKFTEDVGKSLLELPAKIDSDTSKPTTKTDKVQTQKK
jgi:hypothetical protein